MQLPTLTPLVLPQTQASWAQFLNSLQLWQGILQQSAASPIPDSYEAQFGYGDIAFAGPNGTLTSDKNLGYGTVVPNPTGNPGPFLLLGSGGGNGTPVTFVIGQDEAFDAITAGNTLLITAGETQASGTAAGGLLWLIGGASYGGLGGELLLQGGTSKNGPGGLAVLQGGNSTGGVPGDAFVIAGENGTVGGNVHLVCTTLSATAGVIRLANGSSISATNIMADFIPIGAPSAGNQPFAIYLYGSGGYGTAGQSLKSGGPGVACYWG